MTEREAFIAIPGLGTQDVAAVQSLLASAGFSLVLPNQVNASFVPGTRSRCRSFCGITGCGVRQMH